MNAAVRSCPWRRNLLVLWCGQFTVAAGLTVVVPLLPFYLAELGCTDPAENRFWTGWTLAAPAIPLVIMAPIWGRLGDRLGRKPMVVRALLGIALSVGAMGLATTPAQFFLCRLAQGTFGGVDDAAAAFITTDVPADARGRAIGFLQSATAAGALLGPLAGGFLSVRWGFAPLVLTMGMLVALCGIVAGGMLSPAGRSAGEGGRSSLPRPWTQAAHALFSDRPARAFLAAGFFVQVGTYALIGPFAGRIRDVVGDPVAAAGWVGTLSALTWAVTLIGAAWWGRRNDRAPVETNFAIAAGGCAASVAAQALPTAAPWFIPLRAAQGFCSSALGQSVYLQVARCPEPRERGLRIGFANSLLTLGQVAGALLGAALGGWLPDGAVFVCLGAAFAAAAIVVTRATSAPSGSFSHERQLAP